MKEVKNKRTHEDFCKEVNDALGNEYVVTGLYTTANSKIEVLHKKCNNSFEKRADSILRGGGCNKCKAKEELAKKHIEFVKKLESVHGDKVVTIGRFNGVHRRIELKCNVCNSTWTPIAQGALKSTCGVCYNKKKVKDMADFQRKRKNQYQSDFMKLLPTIFNGRYEIKGEYIDSQSLILLNCSLHGDFHMSPTSIVQGVRCQRCSAQLNPAMQPKTHQQFCEDLQRKHPDKYEVLSSYEGDKEQIKVRHITCNNISFPTPNNLLSKGAYCIHCSPSKKKSLDEISSIIQEKGQEEYTIISDYKNMNDKIRILHISCGHEWDVLPANFIHKNSRCPLCQSSKGELAIAEVFNKHTIDFTSEVRIHGCRDKRSLPFDFKVEKDRFLLVEYDGEHHFYPVDFASKGESWANERFVKAIKRDKIKNQYCIDNNIPLLRIPYWEFDNIEAILESALMHFNIIERSDAYDVSRFEEYLVDENWNHDEYLSKCPKNQKELNKQVS